MKHLVFLRSGLLLVVWGVLCGIVGFDSSAVAQGNAMVGLFEERLSCLPDDVVPFDMCPFVDGTICVSCFGKNGLLLLKGPDYSVVSRVQTIQPPTFLCASDDGQVVYASMRGRPVIVAVGRNALQAPTLIRLPEGATGAEMKVIGDQGYVVDAARSLLYVVDLRKMTTVGVVRITGIGFHLSVSPKNHLGFISALVPDGTNGFRKGAMPCIDIVDLQRMSEIRSVRVQNVIAGLAVSGEENILYVLYRHDALVSKYDISKSFMWPTVSPLVDLKEEGKQIVVNPMGKIYVVSQGINATWITECDPGALVPIRRVMIGVSFAAIVKAPEGDEIVAGNPGELEVIGLN